MLVAGQVFLQAFADQAVLFGQQPSSKQLDESRTLVAVGAWIVLAALIAAACTMGVAHWLAGRRRRGRRRGLALSAMLAVGWAWSFVSVSELLTRLNDNSNVGAYPVAFAAWWFVGGAVVAPLAAMVVVLAAYRDPDPRSGNTVALPGIVRAQDIHRP
jgi:hypothetical protein